MCRFTIDAADDGGYLDVAAMMMHAAMRAVKDAAAAAEGRRTTDKAKYRIVRVTDASEGARADDGCQLSLT